MISLLLTWTSIWKITEWPVNWHTLMLMWPNCSVTMTSNYATGCHYWMAATEIMSRAKIRRQQRHIFIPIIKGTRDLYIQAAYYIYSKHNQNRTDHFCFYHCEKHEWFIHTYVSVKLTTWHIADMHAANIPYFGLLSILILRLWVIFSCITADMRRPYVHNMGIRTQETEI